jgi:hypothetical protein
VQQLVGFFSFLKEKLTDSILPKSTSQASFTCLVFLAMVTPHESLQAILAQRYPTLTTFTTSHSTVFEGENFAFVVIVIVFVVVTALSVGGILKPNLD